MLVDITIMEGSVGSDKLECKFEDENLCQGFIEVETLISSLLVDKTLLRGELDDTV
jgi:hypothetical protein